MNQVTFSTTNAIRPLDMRSLSGTGRQGGLDSSITITEINRRLGIRPIRGSSDSKTERTWAFKVGPHICAIWDYRGSKWSFHGPREVMVALFGEERVQA